MQLVPVQNDEQLAHARKHRDLTKTKTKLQCPLALFAGKTYHVVNPVTWKALAGLVGISFVPKRQRISPTSAIQPTAVMTPRARPLPPDEALQIVLQATPKPAARSVPLLGATGRRLAEDVRADRDYPPFDRAMMDGYAVGATDIGSDQPLRVAGQLAAGQTPAEPVAAGHCIEIMTGAACPAGTQAIVPRERAQRDGRYVRLPRDVGGQQHMALRGSECREGSVVLRAGDVITPLAVGVLASVGRREVRVLSTPTSES